ncbi:MAG: hypothetical protein FWH22_10695 [Fibromonadales bacterium]|nr:hypothetical protein [Fibromonadales bacterium]
MNTLDKILDVASEKVEFPILQNYLANNGFSVVEQNRREDLAVFFNKDANLEIIVPLHRDFVDYKTSIKNILLKLSKLENRSIETIINDLIIPPSDVIRFKVESKDTENGLISFNNGISLLENAKKSLYAAACDIINPSIFHKKLFYKQANQFIDSCYLGQTEIGSFVVSIVCPFINPTKDESAVQLNSFYEKDVLEKSLTRSVTKKFAKSLQQVKKSIEIGNRNFLEDLADTDIISVNFLESIVELSDYGEKEKIDIGIGWSNYIEKSEEMPNSISFSKDYIKPLEYVISKYTPKEEGVISSFVGKIFQAKGEPDFDKRDSGEITLSFITEENKAVKARVNLNREQFSKALAAFNSGSYVKVSGELTTEGKSKFINNPDFKVIE